MKILLIDDDPLHLSSLETSLSVRNYACKSFVNSVSALKAYREEHFDVIITAVKSLEKSSEEVLKTVKGINPQAKVILISGFEKPDADVGKNSGVWAYFRKPIVVDDLIGTLKTLENSLQFENE